MTMAPDTDMSPEGDLPPPANLRSTRASDLFRQFPEIKEDMEARPKDETALEFLKSLLEGAIPEEAVTFAAYALEARHSVWWGHECLNALPDGLSDQDREMLALCAAWAADPGEESRYAAMDAGLAAQSRGPGVWLALGAGWSDGSMTPADQPPVPVLPFLTGRAVSAAVLSALARSPQAQRRRNLGHFISMAQYLAQGS